MGYERNEAGHRADRARHSAEGARHRIGVWLLGGRRRLRRRGRRRFDRGLRRLVLGVRRRPKPKRLAPRLGSRERRSLQPWRRRERQLGLKAWWADSSLGVGRCAAPLAWTAAFGAGLTGGNGASLGAPPRPISWRRGLASRSGAGSGGSETAGAAFSGDCDAAGGGAATGAAAAGVSTGAAGGFSAGRAVRPRHAAGCRPRILRRRRIFERRASVRVDWPLFGTDSLALGRLRRCLSEGSRRPRSTSRRSDWLRGGAMAGLCAAEMQRRPLGRLGLYLFQPEDRADRRRGGEASAETRNVQAPERRPAAKPIPFGSFEWEFVGSRVARIGSTPTSAVSFGWREGASIDRAGDFISSGCAVSGKLCSGTISTGGGSTGGGRRFGASPDDSTSRTNSASISSAFACWPPGALGGRRFPQDRFLPLVPSRARLMRAVGGKRKANFIA